MRPATDRDIPALLRMSEALHRLRRYPVPLDKGKTAASFAALLRSPDGLCLVAPDGFLAAEKLQTVTSQERIGMMHAWLGPDAMLDAFEGWAPVTVLCSRPGDAVTEGKLRARGYVPAETHWVRRA